MTPFQETGGTRQRVLLAPIGAASAGETLSLLLSNRNDKSYLRGQAVLQNKGGEFIRLYLIYCISICLHIFKLLHLS